MTTAWAHNGGAMVTLYRERTPSGMLDGYIGSIAYVTWIGLGGGYIRKHRVRKVMIDIRGAQ